MQSRPMIIKRGDGGMGLAEGARGQAEETLPATHCWATLRWRSLAGDNNPTKTRQIQEFQHLQIA